MHSLPKEVIRRHQHQIHIAFGQAKYWQYFLEMQAYSRIKVYIPLYLMYLIRLIDFPTLDQQN
jgi:hypothetical protein